LPAFGVSSPKHAERTSHTSGAVLHAEVLAVLSAKNAPDDDGFPRSQYLGADYSLGEMSITAIVASRHEPREVDVGRCPRMPENHFARGSEISPQRRRCQAPLSSPQSHPRRSRRRAQIRFRPRPQHRGTEDEVRVFETTDDLFEAHRSKRRARPSQWVPARCGGSDATESCTASATNTSISSGSKGGSPMTSAVVNTSRLSAAAPSDANAVARSHQPKLSWVDTLGA